MTEPEARLIAIRDVILGLTVEAAQASMPDTPVRVVREDGESVPHLLDYQPLRLNVWVENGLITRVVKWG